MEYNPAADIYFYNHFIITVCYFHKTLGYNSFFS